MVVLKTKILDRVASASLRSKGAYGQRDDDRGLGDDPGLVVGALGGWQVFVIAWSNDAHANSSFHRMTRRAGLLRGVSYRRKGTPEGRLGSRSLNTSI